MLTSKKGEAGAPEIREWANGIAKRFDENISIEVYYDTDSKTYLFRLIKGSRVLLFRLSEAQVYGAERETECERTLQRKIKDLSSLI